MLGYDFPLLNIFFSMVIFFALFAWIILVFYVFLDVFRSHDIGGGLKALWLLIVLVVPLLGALLYVIFRGSKMSTRYAQRNPSQSEALRSSTQVTSRIGGAT